MSCNAVHDQPRAAVRPAPASALRPGVLMALVGRWLARRRQRRDLRAIALHSDHLLKDIGLERDEALTEARRPFWR